MPSIGSGVYEIRVHTAVEHRICYVAKFAEAIYVLHAFSKRTRTTSQHDIHILRQRYQALLAQR
jgi:phage-related protein